MSSDPSHGTIWETDDPMADKSEVSVETLINTSTQFTFDKVRVWILHAVQQPGSYWGRSTAHVACGS